MRSNPIRTLVVLAALSLLLSGSAAAQVVINEIMYHPLSDSKGDEYLELYNAGGAAVDLTGWCFVEGIDLCFTPGATIDPGQYLVLAADAAQFLATYGFSPDHVYLLDLNDNGELLQLLDGTLAVQAELLFLDDGQWPVTPDGLGPSLELIDPDQDRTTPRNWHASASAGGTPGAVNSVDANGLPPWVEAVQHTVAPAPAAPVIVTATVLDASSVQLAYVVDFGTENNLTMLDDGASGDGGAGDGVYGVSIPGQPAARWFATASAPRPDRHDGLPARRRHDDLRRHRRDRPGALLRSADLALVHGPHGLSGCAGPQVHRRNRALRPVLRREAVRWRAGPRAGTVGPLLGQAALEVLHAPGPQLRRAAV